MFSQCKCRTLINDKTRPIKMNSSFCIFTNLFWWRNGYETLFSPVTFHFITNDFTNILNFNKSKRFFIFVINIYEEVVCWTFLFNYKKLFTLFDSLNILLMKFVQFIKRHGKDAT